MLHWTNKTSWSKEEISLMFKTKLRNTVDVKDHYMNVETSSHALQNVHAWKIWTTVYNRIFLTCGGNMFLETNCPRRPGGLQFIESNVISYFVMRPVMKFLLSSKILCTCSETTLVKQLFMNSYFYLFI